jgi:hypothetical protein
MSSLKLEKLAFGNTAVEQCTMPPFRNAVALVVVEARLPFNAYYCVN